MQDTLLQAWESGQLGSTCRPLCSHQHVTQGLFKDPGNKLGLDLRPLESMTNLAIEGPVQSSLTSTGVFSLTLMSFGSGPDAPRPDVIVCHGGQRNPLPSGQSSDE